MSVLRDIAEGYRVVRRQVWAWRIIWVSAITNAFGSAPLWVLGPDIARAHPGLRAVGWGLAISTLGVGSILGAFIAGRLRLQRPLAVGIALCGLGALPLACLAWFPSLIALLLSMLVSGLAVEMFTVAWMAALQERFEETVLSRVWSWDQVMSGSLQPIVQASVAPAAILLGVRGVLSACAVVMVAAVPLQLMDASVRRQ